MNNPKLSAEADDDGALAREVFSHCSLRLGPLLPPAHRCHSGWGIPLWEQHQLAPELHIHELVAAGHVSRRCTASGLGGEAARRDGRADRRGRWEGEAERRMREEKRRAWQMGERATQRMGERGAVDRRQSNPSG